MNYSIYLKNGKEIKYSIYQRKSDEKWVGAIELGKDLFGTRKRKVIYGTSEKDVTRKVNSIIISMEDGTYTEPNKDTLINFLEEYYKISRPKWEDTTASLNKMYIDVHFKPYFNDIRLVDIKPMTLDKFYNYKLTNQRTVDIKKGKKIIKRIIPPLSINTVIKLNKFLKSAFNYAVKNGLLKFNPTDNVILGKKEKYKPKIYTELQLLNLVDLVYGKDEEVPIILGSGCGLRRGEICGLYWRNVNFDNKTISVEKTAVRFDKNIEKDPKNETSQRVISAPPHVIEVLQRHYNCKGEPDGETKVVTRWKPQSLSERFNNLLDELNLEHIRLHDLRHYNAVIMMRYGILDKVAAERLGHSNVTTLREVYQHVLKEMDEDAADKINKSFTKEK
jgi:integrase